MRRCALFALLLLPLIAEEAPEQLTAAQVRALLREARNNYSSEDPEDLALAAQRFALAAQAADPGEVNLDAVRLAEAKAWMKANQSERALEALRKIQGFDRAGDRARHRHLLGGAHLAAGEEALAREEFDAAKEHMEQAVQAFTDSLKEHPVSTEAKENLEIAHRRLQHVIDVTPPPPPGDPESGDDQQEDPEDGDQEQQPQPQPQEQEQEQGQEQGQGQEEPETSDPSDPSDESDMPEPAEASDPTDSSGTGEPSGAPAPEEPLDLTEEETLRTLDALQEQERRQREEILRNRQLRRVPVEKDW
jgi:hypothetical protein